MLVVLVIAGVAVIGCVVMVSLGRGGEMAEFPPDMPPLDLPDTGQLTAADLVALRLPISLVGYHTQMVDQTLERMATALRERDTRIAVLEQRVTELMAGRASALPARRPRGVGPTQSVPEPTSVGEDGDGWAGDRVGDRTGDRADERVDERVDAEETW